jgi:mannan endo-1,4-beta-mannosidase
MLRQALALIIAALLLALCGLSDAGQFCVIDPPRAASATGTGFYVAQPSAARAASSADTSYRLFDPAGNEFRIRGVNRNHADSYGTPAGLPLSGANAERIFLQASKAPAFNLALVQSEIVANNIVPIPVLGWELTTCKSDPALLATVVDRWVAQAATWTQLNPYGLVNIANEWGPPVSAADKGLGWLTGNATAVQRMRGAGYASTLVIDAGGCGQDAGTVVKYGQQLLDADPEHNLLFSVHVYGSWHYPATATWMQDYTKAMASLRATGLPIIVGEFGPLNGGPSSSQTLVPTDKLIADAEANGWGWMPWSWDDNNLAGCASNDASFSLTRKCGVYTGDDANELTAWGRTVVPVLKASQPRRANLATH